MTLAAVVIAALIITILGVVAAQLSTAKRLPSNPNSKKGVDLIMSKPDPDFPSQPTYTETKARNDSWVNVTLTRQDADGSISQTSKILPRGGRK